VQSAIKNTKTAFLNQKSRFDQKARGKNGGKRGIFGEKGGKTGGNRGSFGKYRGEKSKRPVRHSLLATAEAKKD
jgi:hypothetical protein